MTAKAVVREVGRGQGGVAGGGDGVGDEEGAGFWHPVLHRGGWHRRAGGRGGTKSRRRA